VQGAELLAPPLVDSTNVERVEFFSPADPEVLMAVFYQINPGSWVFTKRDDKDWQGVLSQIGYTSEQIRKASL